MKEIYKRLDDLNCILSELHARADCNGTNEDLRYYSWGQLCQEAKDILQWLKVCG
jgi:hypothetical protein